MGRNAPGGEPGRRTTRVAAIDRLRGLCIISMLFGHFADDTLLSKLLHLPLWVDGAMGFVMVSGIVIGIVRRRGLEAGKSLSAVAGQTWRRAAQLWIIFVATVIVSMVLRAAVGRGEMTPTVAQMGGWSSVILDTLALQHSLRYVDLLTIYILVLVVTPLTFWLLRRRSGLVAVTVVTAGIYLLDVAFPLEPLRLEHVGIIDGELEIRTVAVAARWLSLFNAGLVIGWHWSTVHSWMNRRVVAVPLVVAAALMTITARVTSRAGWTPPEWLIDKTMMAPGTLMFSVVGVLAVILLLDRPARVPERWDGLRSTVERYGPPIGTAVGDLGRYSLAAYVIHLVIVQLTDLTIGMPPTSSTVGLGLIAVSIAGGLAWARERDRRNVVATRTESAQLVRPL